MYDACVWIVYVYVYIVYLVYVCVVVCVCLCLCMRNGDAQNREHFSGRVQKATAKIDAASGQLHSHLPHGPVGMGMGTAPRKGGSEELSQASQAW